MRSSQHVLGRVFQGKQVASGIAYSDGAPGTIARQKPLFKALGLNIDWVFDGTINIDIDPFRLESIRPRYEFKDVRWLNDNRGENFLIFDAELRFKATQQNGYIYLPDPATKLWFSDVIPPMSHIEFLTKKIDRLRYGDTVEVSLDDSQGRFISD